jgi:hypothetical protein
VVSGLSPEVVNIDGHWALIWSLTSEPMKISRDACKLVRIPYKNKKIKKKGIRPMNYQGTPTPSFLPFGTFYNNE